MNYAAGSTPPKVERYAGRIHVARFVMVWVSAVFAVGALVASSRDPGCLT